MSPIKRIATQAACCLALAAGALTFVGCTTTQQGAGIGAATGGAAGAIIGHQSGNTATGALIGAGAGGLGGALIGEGVSTMFCPDCGRKFTGNRTYCPIDGTRLRHRG